MTFLQEAVKKGVAKRAEISKKAKDAKEESTKSAKVEVIAKPITGVPVDINIDLSEDDTEEETVRKPVLKKPSKKTA